MTASPVAVRALRGVLVGLDPKEPLGRVVPFQYNPDTITRTLRPSYTRQSGQDRTPTPRVEGPPNESIAMTIELDATDGLDEGNPLAIGFGIAHRLAAIERLLHPPSTDVIARHVMAALGSLEVLPATLPVALLVWGPKRVVPVRVAHIQVRETAFDSLLNPIQARVDIRMDVLTYLDSPPPSIVGILSVARLAQLEILAHLGVVDAVATSVSGEVRLV